MPATVEFNNTLHSETDSGCQYVTISETFQNGDVVCVSLTKGITTYALPDDPNMVAFMYGPEVLAGLCNSERALYYKESPKEILTNENEREWGSWKNEFRTTGQESGIHFIPLNRIGYETYSVYFPVIKK